MGDSCPECGGSLYAGSHNGTSAYKCNSSNDCPLSRTAVARTKAELRRVHAFLNDGDYGSRVVLDPEEAREIADLLETMEKDLIAEFASDVRTPVEETEGGEWAVELRRRSW